MLSLDKCRKILGPKCTLSDTELERVRDELYGLADVAIDAFNATAALEGPACAVGSKILPADTLISVGERNHGETA